MRRVLAHRKFPVFSHAPKLTSPETPEPSGASSSALNSDEGFWDKEELLSNYLGLFRFHCETSSFFQALI